MQASEPISSTSFRYLAENIQFSSIKNVILPEISSHLYSYGYNDFIFDVPMQIDNKLNAHESSFYMDSSLYTQQDHGHGQLDGSLAFGSQSYISNYQSVPSSLMTIESLDCPSLGASHPSNKSPTIPVSYDINTMKQQQLSNLMGREENAIRSTRKRPIENSNVVQKTSAQTVVGMRPSENERASNKKRAVCCQEQLQYYQIPKEIKEVQRERVPVRRSQKLADRITALQKLVSPYGKTDTASVLHEASIFIKVLQDQIESMLHMLSSVPDSESPQRKITGEKSFDLRNKGLCLVPISSTRKFMEEEAFNRYCS